MKIVLQNCLTGRFLCGDGDWSEDISAAREFPHSCDAAKYVGVKKLKSVQVVLVFPDRKLDVVLSFSNEKAR